MGLTTSEAFQHNSTTASLCSPAWQVCVLGRACNAACSFAAVPVCCKTQVSWVRVGPTMSLQWSPHFGPRAPLSSALCSCVPLLCVITFLAAAAVTDRRHADALPADPRLDVCRAAQCLLPAAQVACLGRGAGQAVVGSSAVNLVMGQRDTPRAVFVALLTPPFPSSDPLQRATHWSGGAGLAQGCTCCRGSGCHPPACRSGGSATRCKWRRRGACARDRGGGAAAEAAATDPGSFWKQL